MTDIIQELRTIWLEITSLKAENAALKQENVSLKAYLQPTPYPNKSASEKTQSTMHADSVGQGFTSTILEKRVEKIEQILVEQRTEYTQLLQIFLGHLNTMQFTIDAIRVKMRNCIWQIFTSIDARRW